MIIAAGRDGQRRRGTLNRQPPKSKKTAEEKKIEVLQYCLEQWRAKNDVGRCCGTLTGELSGGNARLVEELINDGLLSRTREVFDYGPREARVTRYRLKHQTTEEGKAFLDPSYRRKHRQANAQHKCACGTFLKKYDAMCKKCFNKLPAEEQGKIVKDKIVRELLSKLGH